jgi:hypothetical protein
MTPAEIDAKFASDVQRCKSGQSGQDQAVCLREAGAARDEARRGNLAEKPQSSLDSNATERCQRLPADQRQNCQALMAQPTRTWGTVDGGGMLRMREFTVPVDPAAAPGSAMPMPGRQ